MTYGNACTRLWYVPTPIHFVQTNWEWSPSRWVERKIYLAFYNRGSLKGTTYGNQFFDINFNVRLENEFCPCGISKFNISMSCDFWHFQTLACRYAHVGVKNVLKIEWSIKIGVLKSDKTHAIFSIALKWILSN